jgi:N6-L-threonylcarbamoyladenine synthase
MPGYAFSFSGIKTSVLYFLQKAVKAEPDFIERNLPDICASVQHSIITMLMEKLVLAAQQTGVKHVGIAGGVSANSGLRKALLEAGQQHGWHSYIPAFEYCTDNAAMIGITAWHKYLRAEFAGMDVTPSARAAWT